MLKHTQPSQFFKPEHTAREIALQVLGTNLATDTASGNDIATIAHKVYVERPPEMDFKAYEEAMSAKNAAINNAIYQSFSNLARLDAIIYLCLQSRADYQEYSDDFRFIGLYNALIKAKVQLVTEADQAGSHRPYTVQR